jgi:hypothetical protein
VALGATNKNLARTQKLDGLGRVSKPQHPGALALLLYGVILEHPIHLHVHEKRWGSEKKIIKREKMAPAWGAQLAGEEGVYHDELKRGCPDSRATAAAVAAT